MIQRNICFGKVFILLRDGVHKIDGRKKNELENSVGRLQKFQSEAEERFIKKLVDAEVASKPIVAGGELLDFKDRGQRRKLQLYGDNGERES